MRKKKRLVSIILLALLMMSVSACLLAVHWPREPRLLERSTHIMTIWPTQLSTTEALLTYQWLLDDRILLSGYSVKARLVDTVTGRITELDRLWQQLEDQSFPDRCYVSPNGKWVLSSVQDDDWISSIGFSLDGRHSIRSRVKRGEFWTSASNPVWMPDSRRWVRLLAAKNSLYAISGSLDATGIRHKVSIGYPKGTTYWGTIGARLLGFIGPHRILALPVMNFAPPSKTDRNISFFEFDTEGKQANVREYTISLPKGKSEFSEDRDLSVSEDVVLSPHGDRLAWLIHVVEKPSSIITFLAKWFSSMHPVSRYVLKLYTSRLDGSDVQEIGYMEIKGKPSATNLPRLLRWLPDGKRLSFVYQGALWTVPAD